MEGDALDETGKNFPRLTLRGASHGRGGRVAGCVRTMLLQMCGRGPESGPQHLEELNVEAVCIKTHQDAIKTAGAIIAPT
jgi:hypothetical protein